MSSALVAEPPGKLLSLSVCKLSIAYVEERSWYVGKGQIA